MLASQHRLPTRRSRAHWIVLGLTVALGGCVAFAGGGKLDEPAADDDGDENPPTDPPPVVSDEDQAARELCRESTETAKQFLENECASCHGGGSSNEGDFASVLDINLMID